MVDKIDTVENIEIIDHIIIRDLDSGQTLVNKRGNHTSNNRNNDDKDIDAAKD